MTKVLSQSNVVDVEVLGPGEEPEFVKDSNRTDFHQAPIVEGMLANLLAEVTNALDAVSADVKMKKVDRVKACYVLTRGMVSDAAGWLKPYHPASLNKKHLLSRDVANNILTRLESNDVPSIKSLRNKKAVKFAGDVVSFLGSLHVVLSEQSTKDARYDARDDFCGTD